MPHPSSSESALAHAAKAGDEAAFSILMEHHLPRTLALCVHLVHDRATADDLAQEAALQALLSLPQLRRPEQFGAWLRGIARHLCQRHLQRTLPHDALQVPFADQHVAHLHGAEAHLDRLNRTEMLAILLRAVGELPPGQRDAVRLLYLEEQSYQEIATQLNTSVAAIKTRLHKARAHLQRRFVRYGVPDPPQIPAAPQASEATDTIDADVRSFSPRARESFAIHEAAHAVTLWLYGEPIRRVSIAPLLSSPSPVPSTRSRNTAAVAMPKVTATPRATTPEARRIATLLAGDIAVALHRGPHGALATQGDTDAAVHLARRLTETLRDAYLTVDQLATTTRDRLRQPAIWRRITATAHALQQHGSLDAERFHAIVTP